MSSTSHERVPALDGLRGIAILMVMYFHAMHLIGEYATLNNHLAEIIGSWHIGVDLFFVLSGYLITAILLNQRSASNYYQAFYWRRLLRIFPLYYLVLIILSILAPHDITPSNAPWYILFASNIYIAFNGFRHAMIGILWSVAIEEQFYAVWPMVVRIIGMRMVPWIILIMLGCQPLLRYLFFEGFYTNTITRLDGLLVGALIAYCSTTLHDLAKRRGLAYFAFSLSLFYLFARMVTIQMQYVGHNPFFTYFDFLLVSFAFGIILVCAKSNGFLFLKRFLSSKLLRSFGNYSYALYLIHSIIGFELASNGLVPNIQSGPLNVLTSILWSTIVVTITWLIAAASWRFVEAPLLRFKDRVSYSKLDSQSIVIQAT